MTIATESLAGTAAPAVRPDSRPRPGFGSPETARQAAAIFTAEGFTAAEVRDGMHPGDGLLAELAAAMEALEAEGFTPARCRDLVLLGEVPVPLEVPAPVPSPRTAPGGGCTTREATGGE